MAACLKHDYQWQGDCGKVCADCGDHQGIALCFCGWPDGRGREDLIDAGETIEPEDY